ncbi:MAG: Fe-Mn family superoxide dismutase [Thermoleophilia bacterium]|nr:Fe-Mn family superoxide dismutase [Thermoleophilia bacterium]MDH3724951.1 Fe-Mn family superoxide dismutase [Thermoleophilia bacterium]
MAHQVTPMDMPGKILELDGISAESVQAHWGLYEAYCNKYNEVMQKLESADRGAANQIYSDYRGLREMLTFAIGGIKNHEVYFNNLSADGGEPSDQLAEQLQKDLGGVDGFLTELKAAGMAARGWAFLAWDWQWMRLDLHIGDAQNTFPVWNASPIIALDVYEHSYIADFSTARPKYIDAFIRNLDWSSVNEVWAGIQRGHELLGADG